MTKVVNKLKSLLPDGLSRDAAKQIARDACAPTMEPCDVYDAPDPRWILYGLPELVEPCWYVTVSPIMPVALESSTVVVISKATGNVHYCGSACDEG